MNTHPVDALNALRVRVYNIGFGDAILVSVPDRGPNGQTSLRHILIDVGNPLIGGGGDTIFKPILEDVKQVLDGQPLDLYVMTHEHLDHVQGLLYAWKKWQIKLEARCAWLTASAEGEDYYNRHPNARRELFEAQQIYNLLDAYLQATPETIPFAMQVLMANNNPRSTADCVEYLRQIAEPGGTFYVHRESDLAGKHPFQEAKFEILAPEEDTSVYYHRVKPATLCTSDRAAAVETSIREQTPLPPPGVDAGEFYRLVDARAGSLVDSLMAIDRAENNTSIVFSLEWRGWRLLFPGDAEERSWEKMEESGVLKPVHFLKVSHHGSANGTPDDALLDAILPANPPDNRERCAVISTAEGSYPGVPAYQWITDQLSDRCDLFWTNEYELGEHIDFTFVGEPEYASVDDALAVQPLTLSSPSETRREVTGVPQAITAKEVNAKAVKFAPIARFGKNEHFFPMRAADYVAACSLHMIEGRKKHRLEVPPGFLGIDDLPAYKRKRCFLVHADERFRDPDEVARLSAEYRQRREAMGLLGINIRDLVETAYKKLLEAGVITARTLVGLATGGPLPQEVWVNALQLYDGPDRHPPAYHYHFVPKNQTDGKYDVLQYWFFYSYNDWHQSHNGVNDHEADWESVFLFFRDIRHDPPEVLAYSAHHGRTNINWDDVQKEDNTHPVVYVSPGSHASFPTTKMHLADGELEWKPGDITIGTGGAYEWSKPVPLTGQPWVDDFSGKWGGHVLVPSLIGDVTKPGGSPCGPRWDDVREERMKWKNPVEWADLD